MQIVLESTDFRRLSAAARSELLGLLGAAPDGATGQEPRWRAPYPLPREQAQRLVSSLPGKTERRLALFATASGRVKMKDLMAVDESLSDGNL